jgi:hypothetical protein
MLDIPIPINMIHHTLLPCQNLDTPLECIPHMQIDFDFGACEFGGK